MVLSQSALVKDPKNPSKPASQLPYASLLPWAEFWANCSSSRRCPDYKVDFDGDRGLGIFAAKELAAEHVVVRGVLDPVAVARDIGVLARTRDGGVVYAAPPATCHAARCDAAPRYAPRYVAEIYDEMARG